MGILLKADGTRQEIRPDNPPEFSLPELQRMVGGYIEIVRCGDYYLVVNEEGRLRGLPLNTDATEAYRLFGGDIIVGDAVFLEPSEIS